ncbi:transketolase [Puniceicoccus vermicola]|uniref:Transketolase n=1 Tax=Puniceicoccus vermicola TaxID=388746 RepID=A0A7X1B318_9BACT|nr:transketolase [Puniceicoccus vermicola]MBC2603495.1 transketolase [Puniceicoccus vermicola]
MAINHDILSTAATQARGLAIDAVAACNSGHLGLPLGAADMGSYLFSDGLSFNPSEPRWLNRDRFVLSAGHGSMFLYSWLHLSGYDLSIEEVKNFRQMGSITPGHPEFHETPGVECTTGPLGQGVGNSVGLAISGKMAAAKYNTDEHKIFGHNVVCLAGDGCLQEGISSEASALAGHLGLDNFILLYDDNRVTLDAMAAETQSEDTAARYAAYGFDVYKVDGHDTQAFAATLEEAKADKNGHPKFILCRTLIGKGISEVEGTSKGHGEGGAKFAAESRKKLGLPDETFYVSDEVQKFFAEKKAEKIAAYEEWEKTFTAWKSANPELAAELETAVAKDFPSAEELMDSIPEFDTEKAVATRASGGKILNALAAKVPNLISGSADLHGSTKNYLDDLGDFSAENHSGRNLRFGIREHAMGAIVNGLAYDGLFLASGATFATFADYMRPSVRLSALSGLHNFNIWTHDSIGVGEDGPTHQPVEINAALRAIPNLDVLRPGDAEEAVGALTSAVCRNDGPSGLIFSRQNLPALAADKDVKRKGTLKGGYILKKEEGDLDTIILASGSEVQHAMAAAEELGAGVRVVSMPCMEIFDRQDESYREEVLPSSCRKRVSIEAGVSQPWYKYVGLDGKIVGIDRFGISAPGDEVMEKLGMTAANVVATVKSL